MSVSADEIRRAKQFIEDYDHGRMPGVQIPEAILDTTRAMIESWMPPEEERCQDGIGCVNVSTWMFAGKRYCDQHPFPDDSLEGEAWRWRFNTLRTRIQGCLGQNLSYQELAAGLRDALKEA